MTLINELAENMKTMRIKTDEIIFR